MLPDRPVRRRPQSDCLGPLLLAIALWFAIAAMLGGWWWIAPAVALMLATAAHVADNRHGRR